MADLVKKKKLLSPKKEKPSLIKKEDLSGHVLTIEYFHKEGEDEKVLKYVNGLRKIYPQRDYKIKKVSSTLTHIYKKI